MRTYAIIGAVVASASALLAQQNPQSQRGPLRIRIVPADQVLPNSATQQYHAFRSFFSGTGLPGGERDITSGVGWQASNPALANITSTGLAMAATTGTGTLSIILGNGFHFSVPLTISSATLSSITVKPSSLSVPLGYSVQLQAIGNYSDGSSHDLTWVAAWGSSAPTTAVANNLGSVSTLSQGTASISASYGGQSGSANITVAPPVPAGLTVTPAQRYLAVGLPQQFLALESFSDGSVKDVTATANWNSLTPAVASVNTSGVATGQSAGTAYIQASIDNVSSQGVLQVLSTTPVGHFRMFDRGLYTSIEQRGSPFGCCYYQGQMIKTFEDFDPVVNSTVAAEASLQLDKMKAMGVNTITFELRTSDSTSDPPVFPTCNVSSGVGLLWPQPASTELSNLVAFFDLVQSKGMKIWLRLVNMHMEEQPPTNSQTWLSAIFGAIGKHPALDLVLFEGDTKTIDTNGDGVPDACGVEAEPPLFLGPSTPITAYISWAMKFAMSHGIAARKLSAEAIVGSYFLESEAPAGPNANDSHLWPPVAILKDVFDSVSIPAAQRTYAISFYEHRKCSDAQSLPCTDTDPDTWADQTAQAVISEAGGAGHFARIAAPEMGDNYPVSSAWNTQHSLESLTRVLEKYSIEGGAFWHWVNYTDSEDSDPTKSDPIKRRGVNFVYNPVQKELLDLGGFHLNAIPNPSFESGAATPANWTIAGGGTGSRYLLTQEPGEPEVPSRGVYALRLVTGTGLNDVITATSDLVPASPLSSFTTTANLRFAWTGDPNPSAPPATRPQVFVAINYLQPDGSPSLLKPQDVFRFFQEDSTGATFSTFPLQYTTPGDATYVQIQFGAARNNLPTAITLDVDNVR